LLKQASDFPVNICSFVSGWIDTETQIDAMFYCWQITSNNISEQQIWGTHSAPPLKHMQILSCVEHLVIPYAFEETLSSSL